MLDKTAQDFNNQEHRAFTWVLNQYRWAKPDGSAYNVRRDYLGYFPKPDNLLSKDDLEGFTQKRLDSIADGVDMGYFIDTYGAYYEYWESLPENSPKRGLIYGGMETEDVSLLAALMERKKLVIAEFSVFGSPTPAPIRARAQELLGVRFTGWVGRYFQELDTTASEDVARWIPTLYEEQYDEPYAFKGPGIGFFHENGQLVILPESELVHPVPILETEERLADELGLDAFIRYPFWFEICTGDTSVRTLSQYRIYTQPSGAAKMRALGIPQSFPAVLAKPDWRTLYLAGDFTDNPVGMTTSYFKGVDWISSLLYDNRNPEDRRKFFWQWYRPFMKRILSGYMTDEELPALPSASNYITAERLIVDESHDRIQWSEFDNPAAEGIHFADTLIQPDSTYVLVQGTPKRFVFLGSFTKAAFAQRFIEREQLSYSSIRYNDHSGYYDVVIPCFSDSTAQVLRHAAKSRYPGAWVMKP